MLGLNWSGWYVSLIVAVVAAFTVINVRGVRNSARAMEFITVAKIAPLVGFVLIGAAFVQRSNLAWEQLPSLSNVLGTAGLVIFAFTGIESALAPSGEVRAPVAHGAARGVSRPGGGDRALSGDPVGRARHRGRASGRREPSRHWRRPRPCSRARPARTVMIVAAVISMLGYLSANILSMPRSIFAYARDGFLPAALCGVHERYRTPHIAIITHGCLVVALALTGTYERLAIFSNLNAFVLYMLCAIAVLALRARDVHGDGAPFRIPGGPLVPLATLAANALADVCDRGARRSAGPGHHPRAGAAAVRRCWRLRLRAILGRQDRGLETGRANGRDDSPGVLRVACLEAQLQGRRLGRHIGRQAAVKHVQDIAAVIADRLASPGRARPADRRSGCAASRCAARVPARA